MEGQESGQGFAHNAWRKAIEYKQQYLLNREFKKLRYQVIDQVQNDVSNRKRLNPQLTEEEQKLGTYVEGLEPQVRSAVREFNRKGYSTFSSGFVTEKNQFQEMMGHFQLDDPTKQRLEDMGIKVERDKSHYYQTVLNSGEMSEDEVPEDAKYITTLRFKPKTANLKDIEDIWKQIADLLPDKGHPASDFWFHGKGAEYFKDLREYPEDDLKTGYI